jgi:hypothetical protein
MRARAQVDFESTTMASALDICPAALADSVKLVIRAACVA